MKQSDSPTWDQIGFFSLLGGGGAWLGNHAVFQVDEFELALQPLWLSTLVALTFILSVTLGGTLTSRWAFRPAERVVPLILINLFSSRKRWADKIHCTIYACNKIFACTFSMQWRVTRDKICGQMGQVRSRKGAKWSVAHDTDWLLRTSECTANNTHVGTDTTKAF